MDMFNLIISLLLIFLALQYQQNWIVFAVLVISVITMKELMGTLALLGGAALIYFLYNGVEFDTLFIFVVFGLVILALLLGIGKKPEQEAYMPPGYGGGDYGDMMGGI